jgi:energy-converting hydrogenase Eha subunit E
MQQKHIFINNAFTITTAFLQAAYYIITGIWPLLSINSFMDITGPKTDIWLVKTVGLLITAIGVTILFAAYNKRISVEIIILAVLAILCLTAIDIYYSFTDVISNIYLLDVLPEVFLLLFWMIGIYRHFKK